MALGRLLVVFGLICVIVLAGAATVAVTVSDGFAWRVRVIWAKARGQLPELPLLDLLRWLAPESRVYLKPLVDTSNVRSGIQNPLPISEPTEKGALLFARYCASCHGDGGKGGIAPNLISSV